MSLTRSIFYVRIHHALGEWKVDFNKAKLPPMKVCVQCCNERTEAPGLPCRHCGQTVTATVERCLPNNGTLVSCGLYCPKDIPLSDLQYLIDTKQAEEIPFERRGHGGCQSRCVLRGDEFCQW